MDNHNDNAEFYYRSQRNELMDAAFRGHGVGLSAVHRHERIQHKLLH